MTSPSHGDDGHEPTILDKLDSSIPANLQKFDAFPKLTSTYKKRSESRGFLTIGVVLICVLLLLNDVGEFIWGWPDYEFGVDTATDSHMSVNVDMVVNMPCTYLSVDLRDAVGDRLYLSKAIRLDGTLFDVGQATALKEHAAALTARQAIAQSRSSRGFLDGLIHPFSSAAPSKQYRKTYNFKPDGSACRIYGSLQVKRVTANLHITTAGHGYRSHQHVDHKLMNLSHIINEFSFGPYFPDITQPLDYSYELAQDPFIAYQYFLHVVPTTYIAPHSVPLNTHQYSVTHYTHTFEHGENVPGIFFKFDLDPMRLSIWQRTTGFVDFIIRCVGVIGGVFVCMGYAVRLGEKAKVAVVGRDESDDAIAAEASGVRSSRGLRAKWGGNSLNSRRASNGKVVRQGNGWVVEGSGSPYGGTPMSGSFVGSATPTSSYMATPRSPYLPYAASPSLGPPPSPYPNENGSAPPSPAPGTLGLGFPSPAFGPVRGTPQSGSYPTAGTSGSPSPYNLALPPPRTPSAGSAGYGVFPPTPNPANGGGFPVPGSPGPPPRRDIKKDD